MEFFDKIIKYFATRNERKNSGMAELVKNPKALREDRQSAIDYFCDMNNHNVAVPALLQRFEFSLEHGINDTREKEKCLDAIVKYGAESLSFVRDQLTKTSRIAWPIKVLQKISDETVVVESLKDCLDFNDISFNQEKIDKNYDILCYLADYKVPGFANEIAHFLKAHDERVRCAAVELLCLQDDPSIPSLLERFLTDDSSENTRLRRATAIAFMQRGWKLNNPDAWMLNPIQGLKISEKMTLIAPGT